MLAYFSPLFLKTLYFWTSHVWKNKSCVYYLGCKDTRPFTAKAPRPTYVGGRSTTPLVSEKTASSSGVTTGAAPSGSLTETPTCLLSRSRYRRLPVRVDQPWLGNDISMTNTSRAGERRATPILDRSAVGQLFPVLFLFLGMFEYLKSAEKLSIGSLWSPVLGG